MNDLDTVLALANIRKAFEQPTPKDWDKAERDLNITFPSDYKDLITTLGSGRFGGELGLSNPASSSLYGRFILDQIVYYHEGITWMADRAGIKLYPHPGGFLSIGETGFGFALMIEVGKQPLPHYRTCLFDFDDSIAHIVPSTVTRFLVDLFNKSIFAPWASEARELIWDIRPFFIPGPSERPRDGAESLNR